MRFGGPPVTTSTVEEADQLLSEIEAESAIGKFWHLGFYIAVSIIIQRLVQMLGFDARITDYVISSCL